MTVLLDSRPPGLDHQFRPGNTFTFDLTWTTGYLTGRTFTASLDVAALTVGIVGDVMTISATAAQTTTAGAGAHDFTLTETTGGISDDVIIGDWYGSERGAASASATVEVSTTAGAVAVTVLGNVGSVSGDFGIGGTLTVDGDLALTGKITSAFGGFQVEDYAWPATSMYSTATMLTTDNYPRLSFPAGVTTSAFLGAINFPDWYEAVDIHIGWSNEGAGSGTVIWAWNLTKVPIGGTIVGGTELSSGFPALTAPGAGAVGLNVLDSEVLLDNTDPFGYTLGFEIARIGGADTLANAAGLVAVGFTRVDLA